MVCCTGSPSPTSNPTIRIMLSRRSLTGSGSPPLALCLAYCHTWEEGQHGTVNQRGHRLVLRGTRKRTTNQVGQTSLPAVAR